MSSNPNPAELPPQLEAALGQIRAALRAGDPESKRAAAMACRVLLAVLEAQPGQTIQDPSATSAPSSPAASPTSPSSPTPTVPQAPIDAFDAFLARFVDKFGGDVKPDPSVPYVRLGHVAAVFEQFSRVGLGGVR